MELILRPRPGGHITDVAAVDLGSNSFHMMVARVSPAGDLHVIDRLREPVRLAAGLDSGKHLTDEAAVTALAGEVREALGPVRPDRPVIGLELRVGVGRLPVTDPHGPDQQRERLGQRPAGAGRPGALAGEQQAEPRAPGPST